MYIKLIRKIKTLKNKDEVWEVEYDKELVDIILKYYKKRKFTKALLQKFVIEGLKNYIAKIRNV